MNNRILIILPGPVRNMSDMRKYEELSDFFRGDIISSANKREILAARRIGRFSFHTVKQSYTFSFFYNVKFLSYCLLFGINCRISGKKYGLVTTYDPLKSGGFGCLVAKIIGSRFAPEVNGVYTSHAEYLETKNKVFSSIKRWMYILIESNVIKRADAIKVLFPSQLDPFAHLLSDKIVHSFSNYVPIERFGDVQVDEKKEVLFVGFPFKRKGVDILIRAFKEVSALFPEWSLKILGWYPDKTQLMSHIRGHPQIFHHEPVPTTEIPYHIGACSIFVLPSRSEAMGRVLVESMAAGRARIGANVDGIPTVIEHGIDGLLFEPENSKDLAEKLTMLMKDKELRQKMGAAGKRRALREFSKQKYFSKLIRFYNEVLE
jgi:glycosyltransferase involved in cell wall biosynthesis